MSRAISVLMIEDSEDDAILTLMCLRRAGFEPRWHRVDTDTAMTAALDEGGWQLVISDHNMPNFSAPEALKLLRQRDPDLPFIIVSGSIGEEAAVTAMKAGAQDYIIKGQLARLPAAIERELKDAQERRARRDAEARIRFLAYFDPLTSLSNRTHFCEQTSHLLNELARDGLELAMLSVKLDNLREIGSTLGYATAERVLMEAARRLAVVCADQASAHAPRAMRALLARVATDEFALALPDADVDAAWLAAGAAQRRFAAPIEVDAMEMELETSIGIALSPGHGDAPELLLQRTSVALAAAAGASTRIAIYDRTVDPFQPERLSMISELRRAIDTGQLCLQYQPKVGLANGRLVGVEALVRWNHPKLGVLSPDRFIPLAEQTGLINPLTRWVLKEAMRQAYVWQRAGLEIHVAVNLSAKNLQSSEFTDQLARLLSVSGVGPERLVLEVTESAIMSDEPRAQQFLRKLHDQGIDIAIDDFGTGYSSLANLRRLPVSEVKIDKSFVVSMNDCTEDRIIVDSIIELGHKLGMHVVAEGVESASTWHELANLGCDLAQGYYLSRPLPADDFPVWTRSFVPPMATTVTVGRA